MLSHETVIVYVSRCNAHYDKYLLRIHLLCLESLCDKRPQVSSRYFCKPLVVFDEIDEIEVSSQSINPISAYLTVLRTNLMLNIDVLYGTFVIYVVICHLSLAEAEKTE